MPVADSRLLAYGIVIGVVAVALFAMAGHTSVILLAVGLALGAVLLFFQPGLFLLAVAAVYCAQQATMAQRAVAQEGGLLMNISQVFMMAVSILLAARLAVAATTSASGTDFVDRPHFMHLLFFLWATTSLLTNPGYPALASVARLFAVLVIHLFATWLGRHEPRFLAAAIYLGPIVAFLVTLLDRLSSHSVLSPLEVGALRTSGAFGGAVATACVVFAGLPLFVELWLIHPTSVRRILSLIGFLAFAGTMFLTLTRTTILGLLLFAIFLAPKVLRFRRSTLLAIGIPAIMLALGLAFMPENYLEARTKDLPGLGEGTTSLSPDAGSGRGRIWRAYGKLLADNSLEETLFGHGFGSGQRDVYNILCMQKDPHNSYIEVFYSLGIVGLAVYLLFLHSIVRWFRMMVARASDETARTRAAIWSAAFLAYCLSVIMFNGYVDSLGPRWFVYMGVGYAMATLPASARVAHRSAVHEPPLVTSK